MTRYLARHRLAATVIGVVVLGCALVAAGLGVTLVAKYSTDADRIAVIGTVLTGGILLFAVITGVIAAMAYVEASQHPDVKVDCFFSSPDGQDLGHRLVEDADLSRRLPDGDLPAVVGQPIPIAPVTLCVEITNEGEAIARNVAVIVSLAGVYLSPAPPVIVPDSGWKRFCDAATGSCWFQWEGGVDRPVYVGFVPRTPKLPLEDLWAAQPGTATGVSEILVVADGQSSTRTPFVVDLEQLQPTPIQPPP